MALRPLRRFNDECRVEIRVEEIELIQEWLILVPFLRVLVRVTVFLDLVEKLS
jgi:hypothetical protein